MSIDNIKFTPGIDQVVSRINSLPPALMDEVLDNVGEYGLTILSKYPKQKKVSREAAYGKTFFSPKQRRWWWWALREGMISGWKMTDAGPRGQYKRTGWMGDAWRVSRSGTNIHYSNAMPGVQYVMGEKQSRHEEMVGWKKAADIIASQLTFKSSKFRDTVAKAYQVALRKINLGQD